MGENKGNIIFTKIIEYGEHNSKTDILRDYCNENIKQILTHLPHQIFNSDGGVILDSILRGLSDGASCRYKVKLVDIVLRSMRKKSTSLNHCADIISKVCLELPRLPVDDLMRWCNDSLQSIIDDSDLNMIWCDVLPVCMDALSSYDVVKHCDTQMSSGEYKAQCIITLCQCQWKERQYVQIAAMFTDMQLSRNDHKQVVNKICSYILNIAVDSLPPLVHQLLKLCNTYDLEIVLSHLSHYFNARLYSRLEPPPQDSEATTIDMDDIAPYNPAEISRCLSTCIYHISQGVADPELVRRIIKNWPKTEFLRAPFIIDIALTLSDKGTDFRSICLGAIKSAIELREMDLLRSKESAWVRGVLPPDVDVASVLKVLTNESANHRHLTAMGLINLAFSLLAVNRIKPTAQACWSHGKLILVRLCKSQPETTGYILNHIADRVAETCVLQQYADCLYVLCKLTPISVERCPQLSTVLENCRPLSNEYRVCASVLDAVHPLLTFSTRTRDNLVLVCRKGLHSWDSGHRCMALSGFLTILRHIKVSRNVIGSSQSNEQNNTYSYLTQVTVDMHATQQGAVVTSRVRNETMCMEVVSILCRCLTQNSEVKELLYTEIYDCVKEKIVLHEPLLEMFYEHLSKYISEESDGCSLLIDKCIEVNSMTAVLVEPISHLLYCMSQFLQSSEEEDLENTLSSQAETGTTHLKNKLNIILLKLCTDEHLGNIHLDDISLTDASPESKAKVLKIQQIISCYETLIAYKITLWDRSSENIASDVYKLFKDCDQLMEKTKTPSKMAKKRRKSLNETRERDPTQKSQKSQKGKTKSPVKLSKLKDKAKPFKPPPCLWNVQFCFRIVELLYGETVPWATIEQRNQLRSKRDFHQWALKCILSVISNEHLNKRSISSVVKLAHLLYARCIFRFQDMMSFDEQSTLGCVDVFRACLNALLSRQDLKLDSFLPNIIRQPDKSSSACVADILERIQSALDRIEQDTVAGESDVIVKKLVTSLIQTATILLEIPGLICTEFRIVVNIMSDFVRSSRIESIDVLHLIPPLLTKEEHESLLLEDLLSKLTIVLGNIDKEDTTIEEESSMFPTIDSKSGHSVLNNICIHLTERFKCVEHVLNRAKDKSQALVTTTFSNAKRIDKEMKEMYLSVVCQMCQLTDWTSQVAKLRCCIGTGSDRVLGACLRLYTLLSTLAKQIDVESAVHARFERLLKLSGRRLSSVLDSLIIYVEASQKQQKTTVLKLIPRIVYQAEHYSKHVVLLDSKGNLNWQQYLSLGIARDFKIKMPVLQEVLNANRNRTTDAEEDEEEIEDVSGAEVENESDEEQNESDGENKNSRKKIRKS